MRYSFALLAAVAAAAPQVNPISQISDGQIQAPPATQPAASYPVAISSAPAVVPSVPAVVPSKLSSVVAPPVGKFTTYFVTASRANKLISHSRSPQRYTCRTCAQAQRSHRPRC